MVQYWCVQRLSLLDVVNIKMSNFGFWTKIYGYYSCVVETRPGASCVVLRSKVQGPMSKCNCVKFCPRYPVHL